MEFNNLIKQKMASNNETIVDIAKVCKISTAFAQHVRSSTIVPVSPRIVRLLARHYKISQSRLERLAAARNRIARKYYKDYRAKYAA